MPTQAVETAPGAAQSTGDPLILESFLWGLLSAISLNIGSVIGVTYLPRRKVRAMLMSFGGGSLLFALSIELFGHVLSKSEHSSNHAPVWIMEGSAILGGILFATLNKALNANGADVRKPSTTRGRCIRLRGLLMRHLARRLWQIPVFKELSATELKELIQSAMNKERFRTGDIILSHETRDGGFFFIVSGMVRLYVSEPDSTSPDSPCALQEMRAVELGEQEPCLAQWPPPAAPQPEASLMGRGLGGLGGSPALPASGKIWTLGPNKLFGDMALIAGMPLGVTAVALESTKVLVLPCHEVMHLIERNTEVREHVTLRALRSIRQIESFRTLPAHGFQSMLDLCSLKTYQPGEAVFEGTVTENTPIMSLIFGKVQVTFHNELSRKYVHGSELLCTEHLLGVECRAFTAIAVEATSLLVVDRSTLDRALALGALKQAETPSQSGSTVVSAASTALVPNSGRSQASSPASPRTSSPVARIFEAECPWLRIPGSLSVTSRLEPMVMRIAPISSLDGADCRKGSGCELVGTLPLPGQAESPVGDEKLDCPSGVMRAWGSGGSAKTEAQMGCLSNTGLALGWEQEEGAEARFQEPMQLVHNDESFFEDIEGLVTDQDLEERAQDIAALRAEVGQGASKPYSTRARKDWADSKPAESEGSEANPHPGAGGSAHGAIMVWLGILIDAIPESLVIGILINKSAAPDSSSSSSAEAALPFVIGVFLSNLPESMSSSGSMKAHGIQVRKILLMWWTITFLTAVGATIGAWLFPPGSSKDPSMEVIVSGVEGLAAGAMLTMIAQTMLPEAFEQGGDIVGLSCLAGFLCALSVKLIPFSHQA